MHNLLQTSLTRSIVFLPLAFLVLSCSQYDYDSPQPGIVEVKFRVKNSRTDLIPFASTSEFRIVFYDFFLVKDNGTFLEILPDLYSIRRSSEGDTINTLSIAARDSAVIIGTSYAPPGIYTNLGYRKPITAAPLVSIVNAGLRQAIPVVLPSENSFFVLNSTPQIKVESNRTTSIVLTLDLDASLIRQVESFRWTAPLASITSLRTF